MDNLDIITIMKRFPDKVVTKKEALHFKSWKCSKCNKVYNFSEPVRPPAPCECGSIFFEAI